MKTYDDVYAGKFLFTAQCNGCVNNHVCGIKTDLIKFRAELTKALSHIDGAKFRQVNRHVETEVIVDNYCDQYQPKPNSSHRMSEVVAGTECGGGGSGTLTEGDSIKRGDRDGK